LIDPDEGFLRELKGICTPSGQKGNNQYDSKYIGYDEAILVSEM
jgi:hypothetical protein